MTRHAWMKTTGLLMVGLLVAGALGAAGTERSLTTEQQDVLEERTRIVGDPAFQALRDVLAKQPGFLALFPAEGVLHAAFSGDAPTRSPLWPVPAGWSLQLHGGNAPMQMSHHLPDLNLTDLAQPANHGVPPNPLDFHGIRPGSLLLTSFQGVSGTFICTIAFIMEDQDTGRYYAATAGHCLLPAGARATHGSDADWDPAKTLAVVCVNGCNFGGQLSLLNNDLRFLGDVKYARQTSNDPFLPGNVGNDFGLVEIFPFWYDDVDPRMAMWDGPVGEDGFEGTGSVLVHYGNGIDAGTFVTTKGRAGVSINDGHPWTWQAAADVNGGDSGSPFSHAEVVLGLDVVQGQDALGVLTHGIGVFDVGIPGLAFGTPMNRAHILVDQDAALDIALVPAGTTINHPPTASFTFSCTGLACTFDGTASNDSDGTVAAHAWDFGDGNATTGATVSHTFGASGNYTVTLIVRDDDGAVSDPAAKDIAVSGGGNISLSATGHRVMGVHHADLAWSGATSADVVVYRDGSLVATTANDGAHTDNTGQNGGGVSYTYKVCEADTSACSNEAVVAF